MKQIKNHFNEKVYALDHKDGLKTIYIHKPGFKRSVAAIGTPFGSLNLTQKIDGKIVEHKKGIAHFLEHKLFDNQGEDVLAKFSKLGASANAFTSFDQTVYYFSTNLKMDEPLSLLLKFVFEFDITEASVEKEKGIIIEELRMYDKMPDMKLLMSTYENIYHDFPMRYDIGGTEESVSSTSLEDLKLAYRLNYNTSKMVLTIISGQEPQDVEDLINQIDLPASSILVEDVYPKEKLDVVQQESSISFPLQSDKMSLSFKFAYEGKDILKDEFIIRLILALNFTEFNEDYQSWLDKGIVNEYFSYDVDLRDGFGVIVFFNEGEDFERFKDVINLTMSLLKVDKVCYNQIKKRYFGQTILSLSQYDRYALNVLSSEFKGKNYYEYLNDIRDVSFDDVVSIKDKLNNFSVSFTKMSNI